MKNLYLREDYSSQIPALRLLINAGYTFLSNAEVMELRGNKTSNVILEPILKTQLNQLNEIKVSSSKTAKFDEKNIEEAIKKLKDVPYEQGYISATQYIYELLTFGTTLSQTIDGNKREYTLQYIDWQNLENNVFHIAEEYSVQCLGEKKELRPDIVLFVNGIPLVVIENKREDIKEPISQAISQHLRNQQGDRIRNLYVYTQILLSCAVGQAKYGTNGTEEEFWSHWRETILSKEEIGEVKNKELSKEVVQKIIEPRQAHSDYFSDKQVELINQLLTDKFSLTEQDIALYSLVSPKRLLDMVYNFILYDNGIKKIARYQQYVAVKKTMERIATLAFGRRQGGVIWHTQGSGKSLTMVLLAEAIARDKNIKNPKIILVTDRTDLDEQITGTFMNVGLEVVNATTGANLVEILKSNTDAVITTIINKFETAVKKIGTPLESPNIFVLVDEGHRSQYGTFNIDMQKTMPNACYIAFTGTPLFKKDKSTAQKFGGLIDTYTVKEAVEDEAVLPLLYEGRHTIQEVNEGVLDNFFDFVSEPMNEYQKADVKKKFANRSHVADADQNIQAIALDIVKHYIENFQGKTDLKGQVVCGSKRTAVKYYNYINGLGRVSCELMISPPDDREGEETAYGEATEEVKQFWKKMMDQYGNSKKYEKSLISRFKYDSKPELIIVVDKLLTGFDVPKNTVLYLTRKLSGHTLLQAIARVNRVYQDKDYGYIIDYSGVIEELDNALITYSNLSEFDDQDLEGTLTNIKEEIKKLEPAHQELLAIFKEVKNKQDIELYQQTLRDKDVRDNFYKRLADFARILKVALSYADFHKVTPEFKINKYKEDLKFYMKLRMIVVQRYSDKVDYKKYEGQIQQLIDKHIATKEVMKLTELVNIFDDAFQLEVEKTTGTAAKADKIASRTSKHITEKMDENPAFYKKFAKLIQETIDDYYQQRISELDYLERIKELADNVKNQTDSTIPEKLKDKPSASAYYGIVRTFYEKNKANVDDLQEVIAEVILEIDGMIEANKIVDWKNNRDITNKMELNASDLIYDKINPLSNVKLNFDDLDTIASEIVSAAKSRG